MSIEYEIDAGPDSYTLTVTHEGHSWTSPEVKVLEGDDVYEQAKRAVTKLVNFIEVIDGRS